MNILAERVVVTGASGWIGRAVCRELRRRGIQVTALNRVSTPGDWDELILADIGAKGGDFELKLVNQLRGCAAVLHCAGHAHHPNETPDEVARFFAINRDGTKRVLSLAEKAGVPRIVYLSSIAFYDWTKGCDFNEEGPVATPTAYAASKLEGEMICRESGLDWRVARLGTVFGRGDRANFAKLADALARSRFVIPGRGEARKSVLPVELAAELLAELAVSDRASRQVVNLALPHAPSLANICAAYSELCGFRPARSLPLGLLRAGALVGDVLAKQKPDFPLTSLNLRKLTTSTTVDTTRMQQLFTERAWGEFGYWLGRCAEHYQSA